MNKYLKLFLASALSFVGIYLAFSGENLPLLFNEIYKVNYLGVISGSIALVSSCYVRAYRWKLLIDPIKKIPVKEIFGSTMIGYFGNGILAFRLGELLKAYSLSKNRSIQVSEVFGTVIVERVLDLLMVLLLFFFVIPWYPFDNDLLRLAI
ncbi:flippase-like domain-containing protein, partial [Candidatus Marinimicrobia bacterium]|nr:flippase-like domain-containing protein [Candidatus Neomarinimicrobiota bacterium]